jgi:hypothetical protein
MICCEAGKAASSAAGAFLGAGAFLRMLSRLSFLSALNSGCRNSHACHANCQHAPLLPRGHPMGTTTYISSIWRLAALLVMPDFVEIVLVQLTDETRKVAVLEVFWEDRLGELLILQPRRSVSRHPQSLPLPRHHRRTSKTTKLSPSALHRTTELYEGSSSILRRHCEYVPGRRVGWRGGEGNRTCRVCAPWGRHVSCGRG